MGEQVPDRRSGWSRRLVEFDRAFLDSDENRVGDERLGDRRQRIDRGGVTDGADHTVARHDCGGGVVDGP